MPIEGDVFAIAKVLREGSKVHDDSREVGELLKTALIVAVSHPGTGRVYTNYFYRDEGGRLRIGKKRPTPHQASSPGSPPAPDTMALMNSIDYSVQKRPDGTEVAVGSTVEQAAYTEFGTKGMQARPWLRNTVQRMTPKFIKVWADGIEKRERAMARRLGGDG